MYVGTTAIINKKLRTRLRGWKESCGVNVSYNTTEKWKGKFQPGGLGLISTGCITHKK